MNYQYFKEYLRKGRNKKDRPLTRNTRVQLLEDNSIGIKLHNTYVLVCYPYGSFVINSGGYMTRTTKDRINSFQLDIHVWQNKGIWYFKFLAPNLDIFHKKAGHTYLFRDFLRIVPDKMEVWDGSQLYYPCEYTDEGTPELPLAKAEVEQKKKLRKQVLKYSEDFAEEVVKGNIPLPSAKDCLICQTRSTGYDHLISHMKENYFVPSLLFNALSSDNVPPAVQDLIYDYCNGYGVELFKQLIQKRARAAIRKYMLKELGFAG